MSKILTNCGQTLAVIMVLVVLIIGLSACTNEQTRPKIPRLKFTVIVDGPVTQPFWSEVKQGVNRATAATGVTATYLALDTFNAAALSHLIDIAVATKPDGLVISIPDCTVLTPALKRAQLVGIPVISILSGNDCVSKLGLLSYINPTEYQIGLESGQKLVAAGARHVLCVNQELDNPDFSERCHGINDALIQAGRKSEVLAVDYNTSLVVQKIYAKLAQDPSIDAVMTLDSTDATSAIAAVQQSGRLIQIKLATFDMSSEVSQAIQNGAMLFAIDQKPYARGYWSIVLLSQYKKHQSPVAIPPTDPQFITIDNVQQVKQS
jgi:simple sugar transport system substrate-binding protein